MSADMLVKLYDVKPDPSVEDALYAEGIRLKRVMPPDLTQVTDFVRTKFGTGWADECTVGIVRNHCWIAVKDKKVVGFACYDATRPDFFGPTGVDPAMRGKGIGKALLLRCLLSMKEMGYAYAVIGGAGPQDFYRKVCGAVAIPDSSPGSYCDMISVEYDPQ